MEGRKVSVTQVLVRGDRIEMVTVYAMPVLEVIVEVVLAADKKEREAGGRREIIKREGGRWGRVGRYRGKRNEKKNEKKNDQVQKKKEKKKRKKEREIVHKHTVRDLFYTSSRL